jgi:diacylglycerol O-acyltransferase / wax synthase
VSNLALDRLGPEDAQILKLGRDVIRGHTCKVLILERSGAASLPNVKSLRRHVEQRLDRAPRFRQRIVRTPLGVASPVWCDDQDFDIARHITSLAADRPLDRRGLEELVALRMAQPLDRSHPLWHLDLVEGLHDGASALIWRVHHCLADGTTCMRVGSAVLWDPESNGEAVSWNSWSPTPEPRRTALFAYGIADRVLTSARRLRLDGVRLPASAGMQRVLSRELRPSASRTALGGRVGAERSVAFCEAPLEQCKLAGKAASEDVTVNDVLLAMIAGAIRGWLEHQERSGDAIRVKVPVSLHHRGESQGISNHNSYFFVDLPVGEPDPVKRVLAINRETKERKLEHDAEMLYRLGLHPLVARWAMSPRVFTFNVSNVPGPREEIQVLGARVRELYSIAEIAQHHALRIAIISSGGSLFFGLCADRGRVRSLDVLAKGLRDSRDELLELTA